MASEFEIIGRLKKWFPEIGDDAAILRDKRQETKDKRQITIVSTDSFVVGEHFGSYFSPYDMGYKALAASISDIAACGGIPKYALISIGLKDGDISFVEEFYTGIKDVAKAYGVKIIGGDTTRSNTVFINAVIIGETKRFIRRNGAQAGDVICVTGEIGSSAGGLIALQNKVKNVLTKKHLNPVPRVKEGKELVNYATSMIDISDGLLIDLSHILEESKVGARIWRTKIPINEGTRKIVKVVASFKPASTSVEDFAMNGGEDFELLFTIPKDKISEAKKKVDFTEIGEIIQVASYKSQVTIIDEKGNKIAVKGFDHFKR